MDARSRDLRKLALEIVEAGGRGHLPSALSLLEVLRVLYDKVLRIDSKNPWKLSRDRLILSKGHGCIALYTMLWDKGFLSRREASSFCRFDGELGGHPEYRALPGIEASTGSLGHGPAFGVGQAYAARLLKESFHVWVIVGDGELNEGSVWEALMAASHHKLSNFHLIVDCNGMQASGEVASVWNIEKIKSKIEAFGFEVFEIDGHDVALLEETMKEMSIQKSPSCLIARTIKGKGIPELENSPSWHHKATITNDEIMKLKATL